MDSRNRTEVSTELDVRLVTPGEGAVPLPVELRYSPADPFAVRATFRTGHGLGVCWVFARDMLASGTRTPTGEGDVRVWPAAHDEGSTVYISLCSPDGRALLEAPANLLREFISRTYVAVPPGTESHYLDLDATIDQLLSSS